MRETLRTGTLLLSVALAAPVAAQQTFKFEFEQPGVLPSADPDVTFFSASNVPEAVQYSVSEGLLKQRTLGISGAGDYVVGNVPPLPPSPISLDPEQHLVFEVRLRILQIDGSGGSFFQAFDGVNRYTCLFTPSGFVIFTAGGGASVPVAALDQFHTYRMQSPAGSNQLDVFVDGALVLSTTAAGLGGASGFNWGDTDQNPGHSANTDWEYVRLFQSPTQPPQETQRLGSPPNPGGSLETGQTSPPRVGAVWDPRVAPGFLPGSLVDVLAVSTTPTNLPTPFGTLLVDTVPAVLLTATPGSAFQIPIPNDLKFVGRAASAQAASVRVAAGGAGIDVALTSALDIVIGD